MIPEMEKYIREFDAKLDDLHNRLIDLEEALNIHTKTFDAHKEPIQTVKINPNPTVKCESTDCYHNKEGYCKRLTIHGDMTTCRGYTKEV